MDVYGRMLVWLQAFLRSEVLYDESSELHSQARLIPGKEPRNQVGG
jgi:hypothetical protein